MTFIDAKNDLKLLKYFTSLQNLHGSIRMTDLIGDESIACINIDRLFVEPAVSKEHILPEAVQKTESGVLNLRSALKAYPHLVLLGDPGSGKSTIVSWLASRFATTSPNLYKTELGDLIPLPFVLRELDLYAVNTWEDLVGQFCRQPEFQAEVRGGSGFGPVMTQDLVYDLMERGQALVLFDGIDEVPSVQIRERLRQIAWETEDLYPGCRWVFTSRIVGYDECPFVTFQMYSTHVQSTSEKGNVAFSVEDLQSDPRYAHFYVAPFDDARIASYSHKWYSVLEKEPAQAKAKAERFVEALGQHLNLAEISRIPILLAFLALVHLKHVELPNGRTEVYRLIAEIFLDRIPLRRGLSTSPHRLSQKMRWIAKVALTMQAKRVNAKESGILIDEGELVETLYSVMRTDEPQIEREKAKEFLRFIASRAGLLLPRGEARFGFVHLSFQEFFAGWALKEVAESRRFDPSSKSTEYRSFKELQAGAEQAVLNPETLPGLLEQWGCMPVMHETLLHAACLLNEESAGLFAVACVGCPRPLTRERRESGRRLSVLLALCRDIALNHQARNQVLGTGMRAARTDVKPLISLDLSSTDISESGFTFLSDFPEIQSLNLEGIAITNAFVEHISRMRTLVSLHLGRTNITDEGLNSLDKLASLQSLDLGRTNITDEGLKSLENLAELQSLVLSYTNITDTGLKSLENLAALQSLDLSETNITDEGLKSLENLAALQSLVLSGKRITDKGIRSLKNLASLQSLVLSYTSITDEGLKSLENLAALQSLDLSETSITDEGLKSLENLAELQSLDLSETSITDEGLKSLENLAELQSLVLWGTSITDEGLKSLENLAALQSLVLWGTSITDEGLKSLENLAALQSLVLWGTSITEHSIAELSAKIGKSDDRTPTCLVPHAG